MAPTKAPASDSVMTPSAMKPLLALSKREPVQAAIGLTADGEGVILLDKRLKPKKVLAMLKADAAKAKMQLNTSSLRFGRAEVDTDYDPGMVRFFINKEAPGNLRMKLVEVVKRIPYSKVELNVDASLDEEPEENTPAAGAPAPPAPPPGPASRPDLGALTQELAALVRRIPEAAAAGAEIMARLKKLATDANVNIKTNNPNYAAAFIGQLRDALRDALDDLDVGVGRVTQGPALPATGQVPAAGPDARGGEAVSKGAVNYGKCRLLWIGTRKKVQGEIEQIAEAVRDAYADEGTGDVLGKMFRQRVSPIMEGLDESLADKLDEALNQTDPALHASLVTEARQIVVRYQDFLSAEPLIRKLDENTLMPIAIAKTMTAALQALSASLR